MSSSPSLLRSETANTIEHDREVYKNLIYNVRIFLIIKVIYTLLIILTYGLTYRITYFVTIIFNQKVHSILSNSVNRFQ